MPTTNGDGRSRPARLETASEILEAEFLGPSGSRILTLASLPTAGTGVGLLVCSSVEAEFARNYRREQLLARALFGMGVTVQRFQYRGEGNSDGGGSDVTFGSMVADARTALARLVERPGVDRVVVMGTRLGALVAAVVARELEGAPLVLWQPVVQADGYLGEVLRTRFMSEVASGAAHRTSTLELEAELRASGSVEVFGYSLHRGLVDSVKGRSLVQELGAAPRPTLVVQFSRRKELLPEIEELAADRRRSGSTVTTWVFPVNEPWWFADDIFDRTAAGARPIVELTSEWIVAAGASA